MKKVATILVALFLTSIFISAVQLESAQASTNFYGIISSDTTWLKENSPYVLTGAVAVAHGVTLTIEPGVTVNFNDNYLEVNGTLIAIGTSSDPIQFNGGKIDFASVSNGWNQQTSSGSRIENAFLNSTLQTIDVPLKLAYNTITSPLSLCGSSIVSDNTIKSGLSVSEGSPVISNNIFINSPLSTTATKSSGYMPIITNNTITGQGIVCYGGTMGVGGYAYIFGNSISGCATAISGGASIIEKNYLFNNQLAIDTLSGTILNNTITNNVQGINIGRDEIYFFGFGELPNNPTIAYNNFQSNTNYAVYTTASNNINATYNWWGTTDTELIHQQIYDYRNDFSIGNVTFDPLLTEQNSQAMPLVNITETPIPTQPSSTASAPASVSPNQQGILSELQTNELTIPILLAIIVVLIAAIMVLLIKRKK